MKTYLVLLLSCMMAASRSLADNAQDPSVQIEVEVRFFETIEAMPNSPSLSWQLDESRAQSLATNNMPNIIACLERAGSVDLISAPKITTRAGTNANVKVVTEYIYPTKFDFRYVSMTNGLDIERGVVVYPENFVTREVGITLNVTPFFDAKRNMIDLNLMSEVVQEPIWKEYPAIYEGVDGTKKTLVIKKPLFLVRHINQSLSLPNNATVVIGGMITTKKTRIEDRVPILGAIPWFGRLFRSSHEADEKRNLLITVTARKVNADGRP